MDLPFKEESIGSNKIRTFSKNVNSEELKWHFDDEDRLVEIVKSDGWMFQMDNKLPVILIESEKFFIPKNTYHRIIKGNGDLIVNITKF
jgi:hypothetical protein